MLGGAFCCIRRRPTFVSKLLDRFSMVRILVFFFNDTSQSGTKKEKKKLFPAKNKVCSLPMFQ
ncbi:hypothetical protein NC653_022670 [Populus alba x Populus x berolinensis]|uniref:Uncharacterized protein n=1 Tax=Populus alba x Populus x berolinensis TaxID=444605 RepID=A0AAD6MGQ3_9ROSI|nr:hypothetical protein NC653_022670 [Populus alba x Populus x berolinensis]